MTAWHASDEDLLTYRGGSATPAVAASLDTHLLKCAECRRALASMSAEGTVADSQRRWQLIDDRIDARGAHLHQGTVLRLGVSSRPLLAALMLAIVLLIAVPLVVASASGRSVEAALLAGAPLAPMVAVALCYRRETDPAGELALAVPLAGIRLVTRRALLVAAVSVPVGVCGALALGIPATGAVAWLLPGLALSALVLVSGTTRLDPTLVTAALGSSWALGVSVAAFREGTALVASAVAGAPTQLLSLLVAVLAIALFVGRRERLSYRRFL
ncbi:hypothetical protein GCM10009798_24480 [Nocardioides panacihumi]|uniref:Zf-HC2 domain-containing protein n=1 Tax=Nocardioides panacihumi TaxID=400774 RepID=A0ABP5CID8_9ACTN